MNKIYKIVIAILLIVIAIMAFTTISNKRIAKQNKANVSYLLSSVEQWKSINGKQGATVKQQIYTVQQLKHSTNETINQLVSENKRIGNKLRKTEAMIGIVSELAIDTIVVPQIFIVNDTTFLEIDSLRIESFELIRNKYSNDSIAKYKINYRPHLMIFIERYKEGKWRLVNLWKWRPVLYKLDVVSNDTILKPANVTYITVQ